VITTRVAQAVQGDNRFRGFGVNADLAGRDGWTSIVSLAIGGPRLSALDAAMVEDLAVCSLAADPRIWPLKITRLVASYGVTLPAIAVGHLALEGAIVGPEPTGKAAETLVSWVERLGEQVNDPRAIEALVDDLLAQGRAAGFGVAFRARDERVEGIKACVVKRNRDKGKHWQLVMAIDALMVDKRKVQLNLAMASAAVLLDLGFTPPQVRMWMSAYLDVCFYANAVEGAEQQSAVLRKLPDDAIDYVGREPRLSPRAEAKRELDSQAPILAASVYR
jgi:hypothetical protein